MRKFIFIAISLCMPAGLRAQQAIAYSYDAAGNRTDRSSVFYSLMSEDELMQGDEAEGTRDLDMHRYHVLAAPNPTRGYLQVRIPELTDDTPCLLTLFDSMGRKQLSLSTTQVLTTLDLTSLAEGLYLLRADIGEETTTLKIIRED